MPGSEKLPQTTELRARATKLLGHDCLGPLDRAALEDYLRGEL